MLYAQTLQYSYARAMPLLPVGSNSHCALVQIEIGQDQTVRWMVIGMGTENDLHTPIFFNQVRHPSVPLLSPTFRLHRSTLCGNIQFLSQLKLSTHLDTCTLDMFS